MKLLFKTIVFLLSCLSVVVPVATFADTLSHAQARALREAGTILPLEDIIQKAKALKPGQVIETELEREKGRYIYEIEILDARGWVWEIEFDAQTGELLELERDD